MKAALADPEVGDLGLDRPFTEADVIILDRGLGDHQRRSRGRRRRRDGELIAMAAPRDRRRLGLVRRPPRARPRVDRRRGRSGHRPHRPERRGQDHALQRHHRAADADVAVASASTAPTSRAPSATRAARLGIARTFQRLEAFGSLTARENVLVALEMRRRWADGDATTRARSPTSCSNGSGSARSPNRKVESLPTGTARLVELAARSAPSRRCCCSTSRRRVSTRRRPTRSGALLLELAADGLARPARRARHVVRDGHVRVHQRARLRPHHRPGHPDRDPGRPEVQRAYLGTAAGTTS